MELREGEHILKIYHHHPTPFVYDVLKVVVGAFPFYFLLFLFRGAMSPKAYLIVNLVILAIFIVIIVYVSLVYWLDRLVVTNFRIINIDWKYLTVREEAEALLDDIQDISTKERGLLSTLYIFDYGSFRLETASAHTTLTFEDAPDPEGIRKFVYHVKPQ